MKTTQRIAAAFAALVLLGSCAATGSSSSDSASGAGVSAAAAAAAEAEAAEVVTSENLEPHGSPSDAEYDEAKVAEIVLGAEIIAESGGVTVENSSATITSGGTYRVSGTLRDGQLLVDAGDATVQLILDGADISNADGAAIAVMSAGKTIVILEAGSTNRLADGSSYTLAEGEDEPNATLFSKSDLTITGEGSLDVIGSYNDAIAGKDGLVIDSGVITVDAVDDGIRGKDYVVITGGTVAVASGGDGIKADNDADEAMGYISISAASIEIDAGGDAIQAASDVVITGGDFALTAGGGSSSAVAADESAKGIKGAVSVVIEGGTFAIDSADDAVHSNVAVLVNDGSFDIATGDDAIHADETVDINGGTIVVTSSYEGIESTIVTINGGDIQIVASDDGLNVAGGADGSGTLNAAGAPAGDAFRGPGPGGGPPGGMRVETPGEYYLYVNGGVISIDAYGDGIDANGYVVMTGGTVTIDGSTSSRDSALDHNGTFEMNGGTLIGTNIDGMMSEGIDSGSQASIYLTTGSVIPGGTVIHIETPDGEGVVTYETRNDFSVIVFSSPQLVAGDSYNVYLDGVAEGDDVYGLFAADDHSAGSLLGTTTAI